MKAICVAILMVIFGSSVQVCAGTEQSNLRMCYNQTREVSDNYYVPAGGVYPAPHGIFVLFDNELIQVNALCADEKGVFVPGIEMSRQFAWCPICQRWYNPDKSHSCR